MSKSLSAHLWFLCAFGCILFLSHLPFLQTPYFWDEMGQFVPAALDLYRDAAWIPHSTLPNVHPPGLMAYLAAVWRLSGYSIPATRIAMLLLATAGVFFTFLLAIDLGKPLAGTPAFTAVLLLLASPLFWSQSMMAQLDMPAMVFTVLALLLFLRGRIAAAALVCIAAVLMKETSMVVPAVFAGLLLYEKRWRDAAWFLLPFAALGVWLLVLYTRTGNLFGNAEFTHYNLAFQLHPVRLGSTLLRRLFFLFIDNFHWIGTLVLIAAWRRTRIFRTRQWAVVGAVGLLQTVVVTFLGGAALERYLMPVLPLFYLTVAAALTTIRPARRGQLTAAMVAGLLLSLYFNGPLIYPYENNLAFIDFVTLQKSASEFIEAQYSESTVVSAWPFPDALRRSEFGYVTRPVRTLGILNFNPDTVLAAKGKGDVFVLYSRTWERPWSLLRLPPVKRFLAAYYYYRPQITGEQVERGLGLTRVGRWEMRGQWIEVYASSRTPNVLVL